jgi:anti-sigma B factor antagonist
MANVKSKMVDDVLLVGFGQSKLLDEAVIQEVGEQLMQMITKAADSKKILLTFHGVQFMSSAMLGKLVIFGKKCKQAGVDLKLCSIPDDIMEVFRITKMNKAFDIQKDEEKGLKAFSKKGWFG